MSLRIALLGTLAFTGPASGYELAKQFDSSVNHIWQAKHSQIYPELAKMVKTGAVTVEEVGDGRGRKIYTVTDAGREEITRWACDGDPHRNVRDETALRGFLVTLLPPAQGAAVMRAEESRFAARLAEMEALKAEVEARTTAQSPRFGLYAIDLGLRTHQMLRQWAADTAEDLERRADA
ncbi:PadR family transcriptional regulator [Streptomyces incarnatus]|uniref:PadR family transcriptional regulator n=1 Tax=unclassified Streptomyces TaxID=2593676 RepID=UPI0011A7BE26|nr:MULTISPECIES: PadR family transcriptional regulator [Streptomyces]QHC33052.1 PadR family transcriptional regulator [Streptomyces sp. HF10]WKE73560.1 PadR family transcriptional regulator [Streptomyces sp. WP-1]